MKTYKTWEMIKMLTENQNLKFIDNSNRIATCNYGALKVIRESDGGFGPIDTKETWKLIQQPVTWQEAIQAWVSGKTIRCDMPFGNYVFKSEAILQDEDGEIIFKNSLINGKWYIEGDK